MLIVKRLLPNLLSVLVSLPVTQVHAFEAGSFIPPKPDYQLPPLPAFQKPAPTDIQQEPNEQPIATDSAATNLKFILKTVIFDGKHSLSEARLQAVVAPLINQPVSLLDLDAVRQQLQQTYIDAGYIYPSVLLPNQHISKGVVHFQIDESRLVQVNVKGAERLNPAYIQKRLAPDTDTPLQRTDLQERFQNLLTDPLIERANGVLRPGTNPGDTILDLDVKRAKPYELHLGMDNYTTPSIGSYTGRLDGLVRNLTGWGDFLRVNLSGSEGTKTIGSYFSMPLTAYDTRLNIGYQGNESEVIDSQWKKQNINLETGFMDFNVGISHPVYRTLNRIFSLEGQFAYRQTNTTNNDYPFPLGEGVGDIGHNFVDKNGKFIKEGFLNGKAKASILRFIQNYIDRDVNRVLSFRSTFNVGVDLFNATINPDGIADGRYFSWIGQMRYLRKLDERGTEFFIRADIQLANESLLPLERFALGGISTVRGYRQNELVRNEGYAVALELRYPLMPPGEKDGHKLSIVPFFDLGGVFSSTRHDGVVEQSKTLMSTGLGLQWSWKQFDADFYWARALSSINGSDRGDGDIQDSGIHFRLHARLL